MERMTYKERALLKAGQWLYDDSLDISYEIMKSDAFHGGYATIEYRYEYDEDGNLIEVKKSNYILSYNDCVGLIKL